MQLNALPVFQDGYKPIRMVQVAVVVHSHIGKFHQSSPQILHHAWVSFPQFVRWNIVAALQYTHCYALIRNLGAANSNEE